MFIKYLIIVMVSFILGILCSIFYNILKRIGTLNIIETEDKITYTIDIKNLKNVTKYKYVILTINTQK